MPRSLFPYLLLCLAYSLFANPPLQLEDTPQPEPTIVEVLQAEAKRLSEFTTGAIGKQFVAASKHLPPAKARMIYKGRDGSFVAPAKVETLPEEQREHYEALELPAKTYYETRYGTPLAYSRAIDLVGQHSGWSDLRGKRVLDFGYGGIGHLRMLAACGADAVGVDVDSFLEALYSGEGDQGALKGVPESGKVKLVRGRWPATDEVRQEVGTGYDLFLTKNTLKYGYIHPERPTEKRFLVDLGVSDEAYVKHLFQLLKPGGWVMIYNLYPPQNPPEKRYIPWATGRCPFDRELLKKTGFEVKIWNQNDTTAAQQMAELLGWDMPPDKLLAMFTILQRPGVQ